MNATVNPIGEKIKGMVAIAEAQGLLDSNHAQYSRTAISLHETLDSIRQKLAKLSFVSNTPVRTIHHFSCTGGTLIAKCIASMANTIVLNEIDMFSAIPFRGAKNRFTPTDVFALLNQAGSPASDDLIAALFVDIIDKLRVYYARRGKTLVLRDHTHSHFLYGHGQRNAPAMRTLLIGAKVPCTSLLTVRDPVSSYQSMVNQGWDSHLQPSSFDEYCQRYLSFLDTYADVDVIRYEDFVANPQTVMKEICERLSLTYFNQFEDVFDSFEFSGDSGRSKGRIEARPRREMSEKLREEVVTSDKYDELADILGYEKLGT
ncbi:MAG: sulfotransferase family protein [Henriciella sp.]